MHRTSTQVGFSVVLMALAFVWWWFDQREWGLIGAILGLISIAAMFLNELAYGAGTAYRDEPDGRDTAEAKRARRIAPWLKAIGIPLMIIAAGLQLAELFERPVVLDPRALINPDETVHIEEDDADKKKVKYFVNAYKQLQYNKEVNDRIAKLDATLAALKYPDLLVLNCKGKKQCDCESPYRKVSYSGDWNLNAGVAGNSGAQVKSDEIVLCIADLDYAQVKKLP